MSEKYKVFLGASEHQCISDSRFGPFPGPVFIIILLLMKENENSLSASNNPYLLQHADNPVRWRMWNDEVLDAAQREDRPLFISIGYSTCHWCHVMARESFEDDEVAELINRIFIPIKIDREERPDIDAYYMNAALRLNGSGGWPLTIFATPEGKVFFAATYIPKRGFGGRAGLMELLPEIERLWREDRKRVISSANSIFHALANEKKRARGSPEDIDPQSLIQRCTEELRADFDEEWGGFGAASRSASGGKGGRASVAESVPKFPQAHLLRFLMRNAASQTGAASDAGTEKELMQIAEKSLEAIRAGGIYDHIGGGFHRYATDRRWRVPHFEKMLYDQAALISAYADAYRITKKALYADTIRQTASFLERELAAPEGAHYSAVDAESEDEEGRYYFWGRKELIKTLEGEGVSLKTAEATADYLHIGESAGQEAEFNSIPHIVYGEGGEEPASAPKEWSRLRQILLRRREKRQAPALDDKILTSWNGLIIGALAGAGEALADEKLVNMAEKALDFILSTMRNTDGKLLRRYRHGEAAVEGQLEDYAYLIHGLLELYRVTYRIHLLEHAFKLCDMALDIFEDKENGGFFLSGGKDGRVPERSRQFYDGAIPSGSSVMCENLAVLFRMSGEAGYRDVLLRAIASHAGEIEAAPRACTLVLSAHRAVIDEHRDLVIVGEGEEAEKMEELIRIAFFPDLVVLRKKNDSASVLARLAPHTAGCSADDKTGAAAYLCSGFSCAKPLASAEDLAEVII